MTELRNLQQIFYNGIVKLDGEAENLIVDHGQLAARERLNIYAEAYRLRLIEALSDSYPALHTLMGDDDFESLCLHYINAHPSTHFSIRYFGQHMSEFIAHHHSGSHSELLSEMALFEWSLINAFDAKNETSLTMEQLARVEISEWPNLCFTLSASLQKLDFHWNVPALWKSIEQNAEPQAPEKNEQSVTWLIWRPQLETQFRSLNSTETEAFNAMQSGRNFSDICSVIGMEENLAAHNAATFLANWIAEGLVTGFNINKNCYDEHI